MALRSNPLLYRQWNNPQIGAIASNLASIFTPDAGSAENQAQADYYGARAQQEQMKTAAMRDLPLRLNMAPGDDVGTLAGTFLNSGGSAANLGDLLLAIKAQQQGATPQGLELSQLGAGQSYGNTYGAFQAKQAQDFRVEGMKDQTERWKLLNTPRNLPANNAMFASPEQREAWGMPEEGTDPIVGIVTANKGQEVRAPGMDPIVNAVTGGAGDGLDGMGPEGKSVQAWAFRTLLDPVAAPEEKAAAQQALAKPRWTQAPDGTWQMYTPQVPDFAAYNNVGNQDVSRAGENAPGVVIPTVAPGTGPVQAGVAPPVAGLTSPAPVPGQPAAPSPLTTSASPVSGPGMAPPGMTVQTVGQPKPYTPNEYQGKARNWSAQMSQANGLLGKLAAGDPSIGQDPYLSPDSASWAINGNLPPYVSGNLMSDNAIRFFSFADQFLGPILRQESGAAIGQEEYPRYYRRFIPLPNDPPDVIAAKSLARESATRLLGEAAADPNLKRSQEEERQLAEQIYATVGDPYAAGAQGAAQPGAAPGVVPQGRQRATDGNGNWVEFDGTAWVPVAGSTGAQ